MTIQHQPITIARETSTDPERVEILARILADGFAPGYITPVIVEDDLDLLLARMRMRIYEGITDLEVYSATSEGSDKPGAVMIIAKPGVMWGETPNAKNKYGEASEKLMADRPHLAEASKKLGEGFHALEVQAWGEDTTLPFYYVTYLSTAPEAQRKGLGAALIRGVVERAKGEGKDAVLLTQNLENVAWYAKCGFRDVAKSQFTIRGTDIYMWALSTEDA